MQLDVPFVRLPLHFDASRLVQEVEEIGEDAWRPHPQGNAGNSALPLISVDGDPANEGTAGSMRPTEHLARMPYVMQVLESFGTVFGRSRLMRIDGDADATPHVDINHYWYDHVRVHVPVVTTDDVVFRCGDVDTNMRAGEAWVFDTWRVHNVLNPAPTRRIHLVADTVGSAAFWDLVDRGEVVDESRVLEASSAPLVPWRPGVGAELAFEHVNRAPVMTPWELEHLVEVAFRGAPGDTVDPLLAILTTLRRDWRAWWALHGDDPAGHGAFRALRDRAVAQLEPLVGSAAAANAQDLARLLLNILSATVDEAEGATAARAERGAPTRPRDRLLSRPVFIVSPPRSGSTLLFETLAQSPDIWTVGGESHNLIEGIPALHPEAHAWESNRLLETDARPAPIAELDARFIAALRDRDGRQPGPDTSGVTFLEKTPKNALRIPFLRAAFPNARFVYLYRDPMDTMASMAEGWRSGRFVTYPTLPGWPGPLRWSFLLVPGWRELAGKAVPELVALQWRRAAEVLLDDLESLEPDRWIVASYGRLVSEPQAEIERICDFLGVRWDRELTAPLPASKTTLSAPDPEKTRRNAAELGDVLDLVGDVANRARDLFARPPGPRRPIAVTPPPPSPVAQPSTAAPETPAASALAAEGGFRSSASTSFAALLDQLRASLLVSTYQSGRLITLRSDEGKLNTHFRAFESPMGIAVHRGRLVLGTRRHVWEYTNQPAVAPKVEPLGRHDACYLPRAAHVTGDVRIHEVAVLGGQVTFVNTLFSCLSTIDGQHSFVPVWRPPFITALAPEDRCHLNGFTIVDGNVRFVSALGMTDEARGWREAKATGGVILDVPSGEVVATGLCMPHSPRMHAGRLWILESGKGALATVDVRNGKVETVATMPGFTRGLAFAGRYAFVGLSQVRETLFEGVPIKEREDRACGVWVIDIERGTTVAFLRFEGIVQEIFDVQLLPHRFPEVGEPSSDLTATSFVLPDGALRDVPRELRAT